jgi:hypothetical protein
MSMYSLIFTTFKKLFLRLLDEEGDDSLVDGCIAEAVRCGRFSSVRFLYYNYRECFHRYGDLRYSNYLLLHTLATQPVLDDDNKIKDYDIYHLQTTRTRLPLDIVDIFVSEWPVVTSTLSTTGIGYALHQACIYGYNMEVLEVIYEAYRPALSVGSDKNGRWPIHLYISRGPPNNEKEMDAIRFLLKSNPAGVLACDKNGWTPLRLTMMGSRWNDSQSKSRVIKLQRLIHMYMKILKKVEFSVRELAIYDEVISYR